MLHVLSGACNLRHTEKFPIEKSLILQYYISRNMCWNFARLQKNYREENLTHKLSRFSSYSENTFKLTNVGNSVRYFAEFLVSKNHRLYRRRSICRRLEA